MLLRRITEHVKAQNWTAVGLDFVIVVVGVFIGIQVANWNDARSARQDYKAALERYMAEIEANLSDLRDIEEKSLLRNSTVRKGLETLLTCQDSPENRRIVEAGVARMIGSYGVEIRTTSLHELTEDSALLAQQSEAERKILNDTRIRVDLLLSEGGYFEDLPLNVRVEQLPILTLGERKSENWGLYAREPVHVPDRHALILAAPLDVACKDDALIKAFYYWDYWQGIVPNLTRALNEALTDSRQELNL